MDEKMSEKSPLNKKKAKKATFRLLPLVIFFSFLTLSVRIGVLWRSVFSTEAQKELKSGVVFVQSVQAQIDKEQALPPERIVKKLEKGDVQGGDKMEKTFSQTEIEVLHRLAERREKLDLREKEISQRVAVLEAAEAQLDMKIAKLKELEANIKELVGAFDEKERSRLDNLVKLYSNMKPKDAARLFNDMEMELLVRLFERMKESKSAPILALMDSAKANQLTAALADKKKLPGFELSEP